MGIVLCPSVKSNHYVESIEILTERRAPQSARGAGRNRHVRETLELGASVSAVVHRHGVNANQLFGCRKQCQEGSLAAESAGEACAPHLSWSPSSSASAQHRLCSRRMAVGQWLGQYRPPHAQPRSPTGS
nr:transposase [Paraburkholderia youngii]